MALNLFNRGRKREPSAHERWQQLRESYVTGAETEAVQRLALGNDPVVVAYAQAIDDPRVNTTRHLLVRGEFVIAVSDRWFGHVEFTADDRGLYISQVRVGPSVSELGTLDRAEELVPSDPLARLDLHDFVIFDVPSSRTVSEPPRRRFDSNIDVPDGTWAKLRLTAARTEAWKQLTRPACPFITLTGKKVAEPRALVEELRRGGASGMSARDLAKRAVDYLIVIHHQGGHGYRAILAELYGVTEKTVSDWITQARGTLLTESRKGATGGEPLPSIFKLLPELRHASGERSPLQLDPEIRHKSFQLTPRIYTTPEHARELYADVLLRVEIDIP